MRDTRVIFERLTILHLPLLWYYLRQQKQISFFDNSGSARNIGWIRKLLGENRISAIPQIGYVHDECYGTALDNLDNFYPLFTGKSVLVKAAIKLYGDEHITMAFKKELARQLSEFYYTNDYLQDMENQSGSNEKIIFVPYNYQKFVKMAQAGGAVFHRHQKVAFSHCGLAISNLHRTTTKIKAWFFHTGIAAIFLANLCRRGSGPLKSYKYAIPIWSPDFQFKFKSRPVDFLLYRENINKDNTIFILLNPMLTAYERAELKNKNLTVIDCTRPFIYGSRTERHVLKKALSYTIKSALLGLFEPQLVLDVNNRLLPVFFKWSAVLQTTSFQHYVTLNDTGIDHIGRNILLRQHGVKTYYYAHSNSLGYLIVPPGKSALTHRHWLWAFLCYDYYIGWNDDMCQYYQLHPQNIDNYVSVGCLWAQSITSLISEGTASRLRQKAFPGGEEGKYKTISFFDSSYVPDSVSTMENGITFYRSILQLLAEFPDIRVIIKEKKSAESVLQVYKGFGGSSDLFYKQYKPSLEELSRHSRCHFTGYRGDPAEVIAMSDLTVTYAFSSSTIEALSAGKKAFFYDPGNRFQGSYFDRMPGLVAHSYDELKQFINKWLYETDEAEFREFLKTYVKAHLDPYLDGKAVTRFQELLAKPD